MLHSASCMEKEDLGAWLGLGIGGGCWSSMQFVDKEQMRGRDHKQAENSKTDNKSARKRRVKDIDARSSSRGPSPSEDADDGGARKKLRLSKEQSTLLENTFRSRNILSHDQKHELARRVNLTPKQVEVWFQNRRARTKLKQTEVDCEILKRCCESLTDENQRLKQGLVAMRRSAAAAVLYVHQFPRAADPVDNTLSLSICPSCDKLVTVASAGETSNKSSSYSDPPS